MIVVFVVNHSCLNTDTSSPIEVTKFELEIKKSIANNWHVRTVYSLVNFAQMLGKKIHIFGR